MDDTVPVRVKKPTITKIETIMKLLKGFDTPADVIEVAINKMLGDST